MDNKRQQAENRNGTGGRMGGLLAGFFAGLVFGAVLIGVTIWDDYKNSIIDQQKQQMFLTVQTIRDHMEVFIKEYTADLDGLYRTNQEPDWDALRQYVDSHSRFVYDMIVEMEGKQVMESIRGNQICEVYSVSTIDADRSFLLVGLDNGEKHLVIRQRLEGETYISLVIDLEAYYETLIENLRIGSSGYMVLKDEEGVILMHPEPAQWGIEVIEGRMDMYPNLDLESLQYMIDHQKEGKEGVEEYYSYWWTEPGYPRVRKICAYVPVRIGEDFLILSEVMDYDDIYIPLASGALKLVGFLTTIFAVLIGMALYMVYLTFQKKKDTEQIAYLTELNRLLEEMHRSEETIAHQQRLQIMGTMTGGIAHEFNNLLTPIMGYADLLMMDLPEGSEQYENAVEIYEASEKAKEIIQQISSLSRKNMETAYKNTSAARMVARALKMVRSICPANVRLEEDIRLGDAWILCNETQMNQVILNICVNAVHAIGHKEGELHITGQVIDRDGLIACKQRSMTKISGEIAEVSKGEWDHYICVDIQDNGCGMSREVLNQIFDPFFTTKKGGKGTGLGLALVEQIVSSHKGYIFAESQPEKGSTFHVCLPVVAQDGQDEAVPMASGDQDEAASAVPGGRGGSDAPNLRLLLIDDNAKVLRLLEKDFSKLKVSLCSCMNFEEARKIMDTRKKSGEPLFDALVAEQDISGRSAVDFCMSVQGQYPAMIRIVMTDRVTKEIVEAKQRCIIDGYMDKPVSAASVLEIIRANINNL